MATCPVRSTHRPVAPFTPVAPTRWNAARWKRLRWSRSAASIRSPASSTRAPAASCSEWFGSSGLRARFNLDHDLAGRDLFAFRNVDGGNNACDRGRVHMFPFHRFQRHRGLARGHTLARLHQHGDHAPVHRGAHLAVAIRRWRGGRSGQREIANRQGDAALQDVKPVALPEEPGGRGQTVAADADGVRTEFVDFEPVLAPLERYDITAAALAREL